jgi:hypothetical protein
MLIYTEEVVCSLCKGPGVARTKDAYNWYALGSLTHKDPAVCRRYLAIERKKLDEERAKLATPEV